MDLALLVYGISLLHGIGAFFIFMLIASALTIALIGIDISSDGLIRSAPFRVKLIFFLNGLTSAPHPSVCPHDFETKVNWPTILQKRCAVTSLLRGRMIFAAVVEKMVSKVLEEMMPIMVKELSARIMGELSMKFNKGGK